MNPIVLSNLQLLLNLGLAFYFINSETLICELDHIHRLFHETPQTTRFYPVHNKHSRPTPSPSSASLSSPNYSSISEFRTPRDDMTSRDSTARSRKMSTTRMTFNVLILKYRYILSLPSYTPTTHCILKAPVQICKLSEGV